MDSEAIEEAHEVRGMEFANRAIAFEVDGDHLAARQAWLDALNRAERHMSGNNIVPWIRSGLCNSLLNNGDYHGALEMTGSALEFFASVQAPLAALTMTQAYLR